MRATLTTQAQQQVLEPIAQQISQLIILEHEAEQNGVPMPDLSAAGEGVVGAVLNMVNIGREIGQTNDTELVEDMQRSCDLVDSSVAGFREAIHGLKEKPLDKATRQQFTRSARGILEGVTGILVSFDAGEVRKIVAQARQLIELLASVQQVRDMQGLVPIAKGISQQVVTLAKFVDNRCGELSHPGHVELLKQQNVKLRKGVPLFVSAMKTFVQAPDSASSKELRNGAVGQLFAVAAEIVRLVELKHWEDPQAAASNAAHQALEDAKLALQTAASGDAVTLHSALQSLDSEVGRLLRSVFDVSQAATDPTVRDALSGSSKRLQELHGQIAQLLPALSFGSASPKVHGQVEQLLADLGQEQAVVQRALADAVVSELSDTFISTTPLAQALSDAAKSGNRSVTDSQAAHFLSRANAISEAALHAAEIAPNTELAVKARTEAQAMQQLSPQVAHAARAVAERPNDKAAQDHLATLVKEWEERANNLQDIVDEITNAEQMISISESKAGKDAHNLQLACACGDKVQFTKAQEAIVGRVKRVVAYARREMDNSEDQQYKAAVGKAATALEAAVPIVVADAQTALENWKDGRAQEKLKVSTAALVRGIRSVKHAVLEEDDDADEAEQAANKLAATKIEHSEPEPEPEPEPLPAPANPIEAAAQTLVVETRKWEAKDNALVGLAKTLSEQMTDMSKMWKDTASKREFIAKAKDIADGSLSVIKIAEVTASNCTDKRLKLALQQALERIPTLSRQLKIISAVKAANPSDKDTDAQLIVCAQNLMEAIKVVVQATEAASIKSVRSAANVGVAAIKWRKKVYKKRD
eukprot:Colp12_sorted_trinity150504_noHs@19250